MSQPRPNSLTVALVHGAFADSSSWAGVIERLHAKGTKVDLSEVQADVIGTVQRPTAVVATSDRAVGTDLVRAHAERAGADITEVDGSHLVMLSQPGVVTEVIESALAKLS